MDCISSQVDLHITFIINRDRAIDKSLVIEHNPQLIADVEGEFSIWIGQRRFFSDPYMALLELAIGMEHWVCRIKNEDISSFSFESMDYDEGPILQFLVQPDGMWTLYSPWQQFEATEGFSTQEVLRAVSCFLITIEAQLFETYAINLRDYVEK